MNKKNKSISMLVLAAIIILILGSWYINQRSIKANALVKQEQLSNSTRPITDMDGNTVTIPYKVTKVGTSWPGFCNILSTVGGGKNIVAAPQSIKSYPWSIKIFPNLKSIIYPFSTDVNVEELLKDKPDVVFLRKGDSINKVKETGIPVVMIDYAPNNIKDMIDAVSLAGKVIGGDGVKKAEEYSSYYNETIKKISAVTSKISNNDRPKIVYLSVSDGTWVWGKNMPQNEAIKIAGGINCAEEINGYKEVSFEQILKWNPDYIFIDGKPSLSKMMKDTSWKELKAVKSNKVFISPNGVFAWSRLGAETVLQLQWVAKTLYPDKFQSLDINKETKYFYKTFFDYQLTDGQVAKILNSQKPE